VHSSLVLLILSYVTIQSALGFKEADGVAANFVLARAESYTRFGVDISPRYGCYALTSSCSQCLLQWK